MKLLTFFDRRKLLANFVANFCFSDRSVASHEFDSEKYEVFTTQGGPGFAAFVIKDGKTVFEKGFGFANLKSSRKRPNSADTNFNLASLSKQFTAMAVLILEQQGKISTEDFLLKFIPEA
jgi:CubicO group peptidase (beta-lactamase class C family)